MNWKEFAYIVASAALSSIFIRLLMENMPTVAGTAGLPVAR